MARIPAILAILVVLPAVAIADPPSHVPVESVPSLEAPLKDGRTVQVVGLPGTGLMVLDNRGEVLFHHRGFARNAGGAFKRFSGRLRVFELPGAGKVTGLEATYCEHLRQEGGKPSEDCDEWWLAWDGRAWIFLTAEGQRWTESIPPPPPPARSPDATKKTGKGPGKAPGKAGKKPR